MKREAITAVECGTAIAIELEQFRDKPHNVEPEVGVKTWHQIFPAGKVHHYSAPEVPIEFNEEFRRGVIESFEASGLDVQLDFNHRSASTWDHPSIDDGAAAGWVVDLDDRGDQGLWAAVEWTDRGLKAVRSREYRYLSPEFALKQFDKGTGQLVDRPRLFAVALTNRPFLERQQRLAASDTAPTGAQGETIMADQVQPAGDKPADVNAIAMAEQVKSLQGELAAARAEVEAHRVAMSEIKASQKKALIDEAQKQGRVTPAMRPSVEKFADAVGDIEKLKEFLASLAVQINAALEGATPPADQGEGEAAMSDDDRKVIKALGLSEADYRKYGNWAGITADGRMVMPDGSIREVH